MSGFMEFEGKNMDEAIEEACKHFNLKREKLEIDILSGGSSGIFGLVGVKKARIKARPRPGVKPAGGSAESGANAEAEPKKKDKPARDKRPERESGAAEAKPETDEALPAPREDAAPPAMKPASAPVAKQENLPAAKAEDKPRPRKEQAPKQRTGSPQPRPARDIPPEQQAESEQLDEPALDETDEEEEQETGAWSQKVDRDVLEQSVREVLAELLKPVTAELNLRISEENSRLDVYIDDDENSGLIIGREGQTLAALQYMVNRIVSRKLSANVRIQLDTGDYREKQNDRLRRLAQELAERAKSGGRVQSTKPLSSYHRRVVHMALQGDDAIQTRSKGEGPMKKVLILPKRRGPRKQSNQDNY